MIRLITVPSIPLILTATLLVGIALLVPIPSARHHRMLTALLNLGHVPLFAGLAWLVFRRTRALGWGLPALGLVAAVILGELIQVWSPGRTPDRIDAEHGLIGIALAWLLGRREPPGRWSWVAAIGLMAIPCVRLAPEMLDVVRGWSRFPVLASFASVEELARWKTHGATIERAERDGEAVGRILPTAGDEFPGAEFIPVVADWRAWHKVIVDLAVDQETTLYATVRDQRREQGYAERFNDERRLTPGRHRWEWKLDDLARTPGGRNLDLSRIDSINLYVNQNQSNVRIDVFRIELLREGIPSGEPAAP
jgi:hypothetical protein